LIVKNIVIAAIVIAIIINRFTPDLEPASLR